MNKQELKAQGFDILLNMKNAERHLNQVLGAIAALEQIEQERGKDEKNSHDDTCAGNCD